MVVVAVVGPTCPPSPLKIDSLRLAVFFFHLLLCFELLVFLRSEDCALVLVLTGFVSDDYVRWVSLTTEGEQTGAAVGFGSLLHARKVLKPRVWLLEIVFLGYYELKMLEYCGRGVCDLLVHQIVRAHVEVVFLTLSSLLYVMRGSSFFSPHQLHLGSLVYQFVELPLLWISRYRCAMNLLHVSASSTDGSCLNWGFVLLLSLSFHRRCFG